MIVQKVMLVKNTLTNWDMFLKACRWEPRYFRAKVSLFIDAQRFLIKTVESGYELEKALRLRHEVFYREILNPVNYIGNRYKIDLLEIGLTRFTSF